MARLTIDMTNQEHQALKAMAALEGKTIKQFTLERLFSVDNSGSEALEPIKALLAERVAQAQRGELADGSVMEIAERAAQSSGK
jgi:hypothetical protein